MPACRKTIGCLGVTMLSLPILVSGTFASPRSYDEGERHHRSYDNSRVSDDDRYYSSRGHRHRDRNFYTDNMAIWTQWTTEEICAIVDQGETTRAVKS